MPEKGVEAYKKCVAERYANLVTQNNYNIDKALKILGYCGIEKEYLYQELNRRKIKSIQENFSNIENTKKEANLQVRDPEINGIEDEKTDFIFRVGHMDAK